MKPPACRQCGQEHWSTQPCSERGAPRLSGLQTQLAEGPVRKGGQNSSTSRKARPSPPGRVSPSPGLELRCQELEAEVRQLKRALAKANVESTKAAVVESTAAVESTCPVCEARRMARTAVQKKWRGGKRKVATDKLDFQG